MKNIALFFGMILMACTSTKDGLDWNLQGQFSNISLDQKKAKYYADTQSCYSFAQYKLLNGSQLESMVDQHLFETCMVHNGWYQGDSYEAMLDALEENENATKFVKLPI